MKEAEGIIFFSYCGVSPDIENDEEKWNKISANHPNAIIINPDRNKVHLNYDSALAGIDVLIVSEHNGLITHEICHEIERVSEFNIPVFAIRQDLDGWVFHEVEGVKVVDEVTDIQFMNELVLKHPDKNGISAIDTRLLSKPFDFISDGQQEIKFES